MRRARDHRRERVVFGRRAHEARAADIDQFDRLGGRAVGLRDHALEVVEVDDHRVEPLDPVILENGEIVGPVTPGENAGEDVGVERLDPAVEHLGEAGDGRHVDDDNALTCQSRGGATGAGDANPRDLEGGGEPVEARLVEHADEHAADRNDVDCGCGGVGMGGVHAVD